MSKKEMENLDEQVLQVANSAGENRSAEEAEQANQEAERQAKACCNMASAEEKQKRERYIAQMKMRRLLTMLAKVMACLVAAGVFLALLLAPEMWAPVVGCCGIMTFVVMGAICVDRYAQIAKRWH